MSTILVFGHRNPDNDSVVSAVAYAYLKNAVDPQNNYVPARLGPMPKETAWVFERYGIAMPRAIPHIHNRVRDVMTAPVISIEKGTTMLTAGRLFSQHDINSLVVLNDDGRFCGILTLRTLADFYISETDAAGFEGKSVTVGNLMRSFEGLLEVGDIDRELSGRMIIAASEPDTAVAAISSGDTVILGDRKRTQPLALEAGAACIILSCGARPTQDIIDLARAKGAVLLCSDYDTYTTARFASLAQAVGCYTDPNADTCGPDDLLADVSEFVLAPPYREAVVLDEDKHCVGIVTRGDVARAGKREVILVDHNDIAQSAPGIENALVREIVDHHRVGDIQTGSPILFLNFPLGSTATIVAQRYETAGIEIPPAIAAALLSAIMTDTLLLKSPTTTDIDRMRAAQMGEILGLDPIEFGMEVFRSRIGNTKATAADIIGTDAKEYRMGDYLVVVAQYETVDLQSVLAREEEIRACMRAKIEARGYDTILLMVTDVIAEGSQLVCEGRTHAVERAFGISFHEGSVWAPGILSRKKQVVGRLIEHGV